ncbi:ATP-grasp domain-containing protein [Agathobacter ruminis]|uniref:Carbamoyl-phosphate synthase large subunit n=1 Tax=Agathobacter ruminis TaxID=1712665 RepID=A0A2G3E4I2_9FIRM|nr:ATP-grasp domain-containing protein [Agathobacter ruminis]MDC7302049.1 ATP-grasp domain-containing protein [Agathobacter ruminis]PHU38207.1 carbamoyl-phosphate synthase large subunit [Agathobacter ruminis]
MQYKGLKLAIIGASYLQAPLILKAKEMGIETHVFAWAANDVGESLADYFYPISIVEKEQILEKCREINIDGICSIASDLAMITVNFVAQAMGLTSNSLACTEVSTNKHLMRQRFEECNDPSPRSYWVSDVAEAMKCPLTYPAIVKPVDRSGSRGITKIYSGDELESAIAVAKAEGFDQHVLVEEYAEGDEYSVEYISWKGKHQFLALTKKYTTGAPHFIETGHIQPADVSDELLTKVKQVVDHALSSLGIEFGASHTELKIDSDETIRLIEIGGRMGGDFIGSDLVQLSTGYDFVKAVIDVALGCEPQRPKPGETHTAAVRFIMNQNDAQDLERFCLKYSECVVKYESASDFNHEVVDSGTRFGYCVIKENKMAQTDCAKALLGR